MGRGKDVASGTLAGAGTGAAIGSFVAPGVGTAVGAGIGGLVGGIGGWFAGGEREEANKESQSAIMEARARLQALAATQRAQRDMDLNHALSFFQPVQAEMSRLYGRPAGGAAPPPKPAASLNTIFAPEGRRLR